MASSLGFQRGTSPGSIGRLGADVFTPEVELESHPSDPPWAQNVLRSAGPDAAGAVQEVEVFTVPEWRHVPGTVMHVAETPGALVVAVELDGAYDVEADQMPREVKGALELLLAVRRRHFELGVVALGGEPKVRPDAVNAYAGEGISFVGQEMLRGQHSALERAARFIEQHQADRRSQDEHFDRYVKRVTQGK